jgi:hypothetical protein
MGNCPMTMFENRFSQAERFEKFIWPTAMPNRFLDLKQSLPNAQKFLDTPPHVITKRRSLASEHVYCFSETRVNAN